MATKPVGYQQSLYKYIVESSICELVYIHIYILSMAFARVCILNEQHLTLALN